jgi:signal transduction histidine kinase
MTSRSDDFTPKFLGSGYQRNPRVEQAQQNRADSPYVGSDGAHPIVFGEMARLIESFDWSRSPLGPSAQWPQSLKMALNICLGSRFQLAIYWGPELIFLYNDAEREVIGSLHPYALGKPAREVLVDMWETVGPMLHKVLKSGEATWSVDQPLMFDRYGLVEEAFFTWSYSPIPDDDGGIGGVLLVTQETTQRVLAERRLHEAAERERKLRAEADSQRALLETVLNQMPAGVVIAKAPSGEVVLANNEAKQILQRPIGELRSVEEYSEYQIFRLDGQAYSTQEQPLARSIQHGEVVMGEELRYLRPDGTFRVLFTNSAPVRDETGAIVASVVTFQDITDLRLAQEELLRQSNDVIHDLAGKLITAQEEERRRIARDLHDDVAQRIALLSNKMQILYQGLPTGNSAAEEFSDILNEIEQASESVRLISHQLHSSKLILGLPGALAGYCREFSQQRGIKVEFMHKGSMGPIPEPVPLVMFRVLQEALYNAARHSGAAQVEVFLLTEGDEIRLRIKDRGKGFDPMQISEGLGLVSMRERLRVVEGKIKLSSAPGLGTEIEAVVPVRPPHSSAQIPA